MAKIKVLRDYCYEGYEEYGDAIEPGTVIENAQLVPDPFAEYREGVAPLAARYAHPVTGVEWISYDGAYEVVQ
jgi:hypothetical protein